MGNPNRKGQVFVGFWCSPDLKKRLQAAASREYRDLSKEAIKRLDESLKREEEKEEVRQ